MAWFEGKPSLQCPWGRKTLFRRASWLAWAEELFAARADSESFFAEGFLCYWFLHRVVSLISLRFERRQVSAGAQLLSSLPSGSSPPTGSLRFSATRGRGKKKKKNANLNSDAVKRHLRYRLSRKVPLRPPRLRPGWLPSHQLKLHPNLIFHFDCSPQRRGHGGDPEFSLPQPRLTHGIARPGVLRRPSTGFAFGRGASVRPCTVHLPLTTPMNLCGMKTNLVELWSCPRLLIPASYSESPPVPCRKHRSQELAMRVPSTTKSTVPLSSSKVPFWMGAADCVLVPRKAEKHSSFVNANREDRNVAYQ